MVERSRTVWGKQDRRGALPMTWARHTAGTYPQRQDVLEIEADLQRDDAFNQAHLLEVDVDTAGPLALHERTFVLEEQAHFSSMYKTYLEEAVAFEEAAFHLVLNDADNRANQNIYGLRLVALAEKLEDPAEVVRTGNLVLNELERRAYPNTIIRIKDKISTAATLYHRD
jgi:hypothetical protein